MNASFILIVDWFVLHKLNITFTLLIIIAYFVFRKIINPKIEEYIKRDHLKADTLKNAIFSLSLFSGIVTFILILLIWGVDFKSLLAISTSLIAITGVALFANWSILINVTAFFLLLAHQSYRRGNFVRIIDQDNYIEGYISEINLFNTVLTSENKEIIIYPNNLLIARPVIINSKSRYSVVGKPQDFTNIPENFTD